MAEAAIQRYYTPEEYLALEERAPYKSEYYTGDIRAVAGGSYNHSSICVNVLSELRAALRTKDCRTFDSNMKLDIPKAHLFVYPDAMVVCGSIEFPDKRTDIIKNPVLVIEVLSPTTEAFDRGQKFAYYRSLPSLREYMVIFQETPRVEVFFEQDAKTWMYTVAEGLEDRIVLQSIQVELALQDLYHKVNWTTSET